MDTFMKEKQPTLLEKNMFDFQEDNSGIFW